MRKKAHPLHVNVVDEFLAFNDGRGRVRTKDLISDEEFTADSYIDKPAGVQQEQQVLASQVTEHQEPQSPQVPETQQVQGIDATGTQASVLQDVEITDEPQGVQEEPVTELIKDTKEEEVKAAKQAKPIMSMPFSEVAAITQKTEPELADFDPTRDMVKEVVNFEPTTRNERHNAVSVGTAVLRFVVPKAGQPAGEIIAPKKPEQVSKYKLENWEAYQEELAERKKREAVQQKQEPQVKEINGVPVKGPDVLQKRRITIKTASEERLSAIKRAETNKKDKGKVTEVIDQEYAVNFTEGMDAYHKINPLFIPKRVTYKR